MSQVLERLWPEFLSWYLSAEGGQTKRCADGRAKWANIVQRDDDLYKWGIKHCNSWNDADEEDVGEYSFKISNWKQNRTAAAKQRLGWETKIGPVNHQHKVRIVPTIPPGQALHPGSVCRGYGLGPGATFVEQLESGSGYHKVACLTEDEFEKEVRTVDTKAFELANRLESKMGTTDAAFPFGTVPQQHTYHGELGPKIESDFVLGPWERQHVFLIDKAHTEYTKEFRMKTPLADAMAASMCCSKPDWQYVISTTVLNAVNKEVAQLYPSARELWLDVAAVQQAGVAAFAQIGVDVEIEVLRNVEAAKEWVTNQPPMQTMRASGQNPATGPPRQTAPKDISGLTWQGCKWIRPHNEGEVIDDVLRVGDSFFSILRFPLDAAPPRCLHQHHKYVMLTDIYQHDETGEEVRFCVPGAIIMPHATTLLDILEVHDIAFQLAACTMATHGQIYPKGDDAMLKVSITRDICSTLDVDLSWMTPDRQAMIVAPWSGAPLHDVWALPIELEKQLGSVGSGKPCPPCRPYAKMGSNAHGWPVAHHEGTMQDAGNPSFLSAIVALTQDMDIKVWEFSQDLLSFMNQTRLDRPKLSKQCCSQDMEADWMRAHAPQGSLVSRGVQIIPTKMTIPKTSSFLYLPTLVIAESPLPTYSKELRYTMHVQVYKRRHKDIILHRPAREIHPFVMQCCANWEGTGTWDRNRLYRCTCRYTSADAWI